jgi:glycosyltransferase involved in cell wall biosynthesis
MKYSFVLLAYNQQDFIAEAVSAALAQEGLAIEIVLSDDCSTDRTFEIMKEIVADYRGPHQVLLNRNDNNLGVVAHIRKANAMSTGDVLIAASGDDISRPDRSRRIIEAFETTNAWLVHSHATCIDLEGKEVPPTYLSADLVRGADLLTIAKSQGLYLGATAAFDRKIFRKYGYVSNPNAYEDLVYGFRATLENGVHFIDEPLVKYRVGSGISTYHLHADVEGKRLAEIRRLRTALAVLAQRRRDALLYGLSPADPVLRTINKHRLKAFFQLYFWGALSPSRCSRLLWHHPVLALSERRRVRRRNRKLSPRQV